MKKKLVSVLLCTAMVGTMLVGCGGGSKDAGSTDKAASTEKTADAVQYVSMWSDTEPQAETISAAAEAFEKETGIQVQIEFAGRQGIREGLQTRLDAKENIDMFDEDIDRVNGQWGDYLLELDDYVKADYNGKAYKDYINPSFDNIYTAATELGGGKLKTIPYQPFVFDMVYNKTIFKEAGVTETPKTWDEFLAACEKIKAAGYTPLTVDNAYISCLLGYTLAEFVGADGVEDIVMNDDWSNEAVLKSVKLWQEMFDKGYISEYAATNIYPNAQTTEFAPGDAAMYLNGTWLANEIKADVDSEKVEMGIFAFPAISGGVNGPEAANFGSQVLAINKDSDKADEAFQFIAYLTTGEWDAKLSENTLGIPMDATNSWPAELSDAEAMFPTLTTRYPWAANMDNNTDNTDAILSNFTEVISGGKTAEDFVSAMSGK